MDYKSQLFNIALACRNCAHAPYSGFKVGTALLSKNKKIFSGVNVENISFPCGSCAEANAVAAMVCAGETEIAEILIVADTENIVPCGNCLQKIAEFATPQTLVHSANLKGNIKTYELGELLPHCFNAKEVKNA